MQICKEKQEKGFQSSVCESKANNYEQAYNGGKWQVAEASVAPGIQEQMMSSAYKKCEDFFLYEFD